MTEGWSDTSFDSLCGSVGAVVESHASQARVTISQPPRHRGLTHTPSILRPALPPHALSILRLALHRRSTSRRPSAPPSALQFRLSPRPLQPPTPPHLHTRLAPLNLWSRACNHVRRQGGGIDCMAQFLTSQVRCSRSRLRVWLLREILGKTLATLDSHPSAH